ncbi:MAG: tRNA uridine-5-carboxymethylaminomethyl(34) synthesis GTPase MnmE [Isosphaera sp.]|nr:tRNA uridine-5-carboxymethylaminomethyl(34) synthesis GTPase MnmE [Isosphaera sp.]
MSFGKTAGPHPGDTIVAVSSAPGPGARAVVRVGGPGALDLVNTTFSRDAESSERSAPPPRRGRFVPGSLRLSGVPAPLPATLYFFPGPRSYTGQDLAELHTIGSPPLVERLVADLVAAGARPALPGEFTLRAFLAGKTDLPRAEAVQAVVAAGTDADLRAALDQLAGGVSRPLEALRDDLLNLLADLEAALDFADEDLEFVGRDETLGRLDAALGQLDALLRRLDDRGVSGRPVRVALVGRPNAGKSSLFNALAGGDALVSPVPGTTRDYLVKRLDLGGVAVELVDTAGWEAAADAVADQAQRLGRGAAQAADVVLWCDEDGAFADDDAARLAATAAEVLRVRTKSDRASRERERPEAVPCSVLAPGGTTAVAAALRDTVLSLARPALAPSQSRCRGHLAGCAADLRVARDHASAADPPELAAAALRAALDRLGEVTGAVYTDDLLDRVFSRFCIGK